MTGWSSGARRAPSFSVRAPLLLAGALALALGGCALLPFGRKKPPPAPPASAPGARPDVTAPAAAPAEVPTATLTLEAAPDANGGNAVRLRVYVLRDPTAFGRAGAEALWRDGEGTLGDDVLSVEEVRLYPREAKAVVVRLVEGAGAVGVAADFRRPVENEWRRALPAAEARRGLRVLVGAGRLTLAP